MARRERVVSVRFALTEHARLLALRDAEPVRDERGRALRSLAHWCRVAVTRAVLTDTLRPGMPAVSPGQVEAITRACSVLNDRAFETNRVQHVVADSLASLDVVVRLVTDALPPIAEAVTAPNDEARNQLVNIWVSSDDHGLWTRSAHEVGFSRASGWAWDVLVGVGGFVRHRVATDSVVMVRRQIAGAINNAAQLQAVATDTDAGVAQAIEDRAVDLVALIAQWNALGRPR